MGKTITFSDLQKQGLKLAKIVANREVDEKNVMDKMADMRRLGAIETVKVVKAADAINEGLAVVDFTNQKQTVDAKMAKKYFAILDGQNRTTAHLSLSAERDESGNPTYTKEIWFELLPEDRPYSIMEYICRVNDPGHTWNLNHYTHAAGELHGDYPTLAFIATLVSQGFSYSSAAKWATLNRRITPSMVREAVNTTNGVDPQFAIAVNLEDGERLVTAARKTLDITIVKGRTLVDWVIDMLGDKISIDRMERFFLNLSKEQAKSLKDLKGDKNGASKEMKVKTMLNDLFYNGR